MNKLLSLVKYLIGWPLSLIALIFVFNLIYSNLSKSSNYLNNINFGLLIIGIILFVIYFYLRSLLWSLILGEKTKHLGLKLSTYYWSISELKRYIPGSIWAFASRTTAFESDNLSKKEILVLLAHESLVVALSAFIFSLFYIFNKENNFLINNLLLIVSLLGVFFYLTLGRCAKKFEKHNLLYKTLILLFPTRSYFENLKVLLVGILTFFIFGLASYFSTVSFVYLDLKNILIISSLFTFSYFIGYISIITPMGLGVREGIITYGLLSFTTSGAAAIASIFARVLSIVSELISILIIYLLTKIKSKSLKDIEKFIITHKTEIFLIIFILLYIGYFTAASFLRYTNFYTGRFDLGNMDQTVWNTIHGRIFQLTDPDGVNTISRLSVHADFILILISPLYLLWSNPRTLLLLQTIVLGVGALFLYLIAKEILKNKNLALTLATIFLLNPALQYTNLYDFHPVTLATSFLLATFYFFIKKNYKLFLVFGLLTALTKEELWAVVGFFGIFVLARSYFENRPKFKIREIVFGISILIIGVSMSYLLISKIIPFVKGSDHFALTYYADFGGSTTEIAKNILLNPVKLFSTLLEKSRLYFLYQIFLPVGFLSLLSPLLLIFALPDLMIDLLSNNSQLHQIYYQYTAVITPFIFISTIFAIRRLLNRFPQITTNYIAIYLLIATLLAAYLSGPLPGASRPNINMFTKQLTNKQEITKIISIVPRKYSIAATNNLGSHLSRRENIYNIPIGIDRADVIIFLIDRGFTEQTINEQKNMITKIKNNKHYVLFYETTDFVAFKKPSVKLSSRM